MCVCVHVNVKKRVKERMKEFKKEDLNKRGRVCWSATFILCCARKNVNYSKVRTAITYHLTVPNKITKHVQEVT